MKILIVGVSDCVVTDEPDVALVTYALGSCIAVSTHDPVTRLGGLLHFMLPDSNLNRAKAKENPNMFADTGIQLLLRLVSQRGIDPRKCTWRLAGGAQVLDGEGAFQIGNWNYLAAKRLLWKEGVPVSGEAVGGEISRTVRLELNSGTLWVREGGGPEVVLTSQSQKGRVCRLAS